MARTTLSEGVLYTDFYQLTMAQLYFHAGLHEQPVHFEYFFRTYPSYDGHQAGYCVFAGLEWLLRWMERVRFDQESLTALREHRGAAGQRLFSDEFLDYLAERGNFGSLSMRAVPEGRVVHSGAPLVTVTGPAAMAQLLESALLNHLNYPTLTATKAARIDQAGLGRPVIEFGMRRAQYAAANAGARAALIGGADFSSNTGISYELGVPPKGTHAHSMIQMYMALGMGELTAFRAYAEAYPDDCLLLVDTVDTLKSGLPNAITVFQELREKGRQPRGIRLDSGDLAYLSILSARMLNEAGFDDVAIVLSNQLDEMVLLQIVEQIREEASSYGVDPEKLINRLIYGVGTRLITSAGHGALDGVYKLVAVHDGRRWAPALKTSETREKTINPGRKQAYRVYASSGMATADYVALEDESPEENEELVLRHPTNGDVWRTLHRTELADIEPLLVDVFSGGAILGEYPSLEHMRENCDSDLGRLDPGVRRFINPHRYHVSLSQRLWDMKSELVRQTLNEAPAPA